MDSQMEEAKEPGACDHLAAYAPEARKEMVKRYKKYMSWSTGMDMVPARVLRKRESPYPSCSSCTLSLLRPTVCLTCDLAFCRIIPSPATSSGHPAASGSSRAPTGVGMKSKGKAKMVGCRMAHVEASKHELALDTATGTIFCHSCSDFIYPEGFVVQASRNKRMAEERADGSTLSAKRAKFKAWKQTSKEGQALLEGMDRMQCHGLRPLLNLSQTCFLSAILQAFLINPLFRSYYLSDKHNRLSCEARRAAMLGSSAGHAQNGSSSMPLSLLDDDADGERDSDAGSMIMNMNGNGSSVSSGAGDCMSCEMDRAFDQAYSGDSSPYGPVSMLFAMWKASDELAGYAQQDAHTFFLAALNQIHAHSPERADHAKGCRCVAHQAFSGSLLSTVTCARCNTSTRTEEPLLDLNLELKPSSIPGKELNRPELRGALTLLDCLKRYTSKEGLSDRSYSCAKCVGQTTEATKQLSIKNLPATLAIQLKRFEHSVDKTSKVDTMVHFPTNLDMRPYTSDVLHKSKGVLNLPTEMYRYQLSAVVTHEGKLDNGHYWADVRSGYEWFRCDDEKVTNTTLAAVLAQKAYMLFYVKTSLAYENEPAENQDKKQA